MKSLVDWQDRKLPRFLNFRMAPSPYSDVGKRVKAHVILRSCAAFDEANTLRGDLERNLWIIDAYTLQVSTTVTMNEVLPSTRAALSFKLPDHKSGKLDVQYLHHHAAINSSIGLTPTPFVDLAAAIGTKELSIGGEIGFDTATASITKCNAGIGVNKPDFSAALMLVEKGESLKASYIHEVNPIYGATVGAELTHRLSSNENSSFTIGTSYAPDPFTSIKTRLSNEGSAAMVVQREWRPKSLITMSAECNTWAINKAPRFGLALALKP
ncbi:hypothetical protein Syun_024924 [Stephania yunnanensis]|uniref:Uncharacterized protein n=1 Tax=Stephania yunnanensis TaxID=152371 RepID=A0AAP0ER53_9MAGN